MSEDESGADEIDRLLDSIRKDWRRLSSAAGDFEQRRIKQEMQRRFEDLRRRLDEAPKRETP